MRNVKVGSIGLTNSSEFLFTITLVMRMQVLQPCLPVGMEFRLEQR